MSKNMKRLISALLAIGMLVSSFGMVVMAEDSTAQTTAAEDSSKWTSDNYYNEAIGLLSALKIFQGYEDGSFKPDSTITRAEMAAVILRTLGVSTNTTYSGIFTDVDSSHWAASTIQTAADSGIINGMGDGTFAPDSPVKYEQAVKMIVCALRYDALAQGNGGYPTGYITVASKKKIEVIKNASGSVGDDVKRGTVAKMIYNAINALYPTGTALTSDGIEYTTSDDVTLGSEIFDLYKVEGLVTATKKTSIDPSADVTDEQVVIDGDIYYLNGLDMEQYVGSCVKAYYQEFNNDGIMKLVYVTLDKDMDILTIDADDVDEIANITSNNATIKYYYEKNSTRTKTAKLKSPNIVYNSKLLTSADVAAATGKTYSEDVLIDFITPEVGSLVLKDYDNDGYYDVLFVSKYDTYVVASATDKLITGKYNDSSLDVDTEDDDKIVTITKAGKTILSKSLKKWDVATVMASVNTTGDKVITIDVCNDTITGKVDETDTSDKDEFYATISGKQYKVDSLVKSDISVGKEGTFYLDKFGRIAGMDSTSGGKLSGSEKYGWLINVKHNTDADNTTVKLFTQEGKVVTYEVADKLEFWGSQASNSLTVLDFTSGSSVTLDGVKYDNAEAALMGANTIANSTTVGGCQMKLVKYSLNSSGKVKKLYMAVATTDYTNDAYDDRVVVYNANLTGSTGSGSMLAKKFYLTDNMVQFNVPKYVANIDDTESYAVSTAKKSEYIYYDGVSIDFTVGEFEGSQPNVVIRFVSPSDAAQAFTYNTADDAPQMIVSKIQEIYDEASDETVYKITGYQYGNKVEYTTTSTTSASVAKGISGGGVGTSDANRYYGVTELWTAASKQPQYNGSDIITSANQSTYKKLTDVISVGDIIGVSASGTKANIIIKMVDVSDYISKGTMVWGAYAAYSNTRDGIAFGNVVSTDTDSQLIIKLSTGDSFAVDPGYYMDAYVYKVDSGKGEIKDGLTVSELVPYDDSTGLGDKVYIRNFKGGQREVFVIRYE